MVMPNLSASIYMVGYVVTSFTQVLDHVPRLRSNGVREPSIVICMYAHSAPKLEISAGAKQIAEKWRADECCPMGWVRLKIKLFIVDP
jgi:hypothetical protein